MTPDELREKFEAWYVENAFDYPSNPIGSRECGLQWKAWQAAHASRDAEVEALKHEVDDLSALVRRLAHSLDKPSGNTLLARQAMDYLRRHDLQGSPMRNND